MNESFRKLLDLARRTGDRLIVTDPEGEDTFVLMGLDQYEKFLKPTTASHPSAPANPSVPSSSPSDIFDVLPSAGSQADTWELGKLSSKEQDELETQYQAYLKEKDREKEKGKSHPVSLAEKPLGEEELGEDQFYLEPIE